jgi:hypothetical protein
MSNIILSKLIHTRPNKDVPWFNEVVIDPEFNEYVRLNYFNTGKMLTKGSTSSDDLLILIFTSQWRSEQDHLDYLKDPTVKEKNSQKIDFCKEHGIKLRFEITEFDRKGNVVKKNEGILIK